MGFSYQIIPVSESVRDQQFFNWLDSWEVTYPQEFSLGRYPTVDELKDSLEGLENCTVRFYPRIQKAEIVFADYTSEFTFRQNSNGEIEHLSFRKGDYVMVKQAVQAFANRCGTFLMMIEGEDPELIFPDLAK